MHHCKELGQSKCSVSSVQNEITSSGNPVIFATFFMCFTHFAVLVELENTIFVGWAATDSVMGPSACLMLYKPWFKTRIKQDVIGNI